jgi:pimeloyl-ACP methyl ester carboxylesterase
MQVENVLELDPYELPGGIRSRVAAGINGLDIHYLEAGYEKPGSPCVLLLHGFPELAYSWRKIMPALAAAGYHVVAPDQRGYGRTTGWDGAYETSVDSFRLPNLVRDALGLVSALGYRSVAAVVGHDFGAPVAGYCALLRPDVFRSLVLMSAPFSGPPAIPFNTLMATGASKPAAPSLPEQLAALPIPRKHYTAYFATPQANENMLKAPQGLRAFLRAYFHYKSGDWKANEPFELGGMTGAELAKMPHYYIMNLHEGMAETVAREMPSAAAIAQCQWLTERELDVYVQEFSRTGFQGGLQWYRCKAPKYIAELETFSGMQVLVPSMFIAGQRDWGVYQYPGGFQKMQSEVCRDLRGVHLLEDAGHWVQQEKADEVARLLLAFLHGQGA